MFGLIRFVAFFGGVAAGAQLASGIVRGVKLVCRGQPVAGLIEVADGMAAPILTAVTEVSKFGKEVYDAVRGPWSEESKEEPKELASAREVNRCQQEHPEEGASTNGVLSLATRS
jgi:hypothetical protein